MLKCRRNKSKNDRDREQKKKYFMMVPTSNKYTMYHYHAKILCELKTSSNDREKKKHQNKHIANRDRYNDARDKTNDVYLKMNAWSHLAIIVPFFFSFRIFQSGYKINVFHQRVHTNQWNFDDLANEILCFTTHNSICWLTNYCCFCCFSLNYL